MSGKNWTGDDDSNLELTNYRIPIPEVINVKPKNSNFEDETGIVYVT